MGFIEEVVLPVLSNEFDSSVNEKFLDGVLESGFCIPPWEMIPFWVSMVTPKADILV